MTVLPAPDWISFTGKCGSYNISGKSAFVESGRMSRYRTRSAYRVAILLWTTSIAKEYHQKLFAWSPHNILNEGSPSGMCVSGRIVLFWRLTNTHNLNLLSR